MTVILNSDSHGHLVIHVGHCDSHIGSFGHGCDEAAETIIFVQKSAVNKPYLQRNGPEASTVIVMVIS